MAGKDKAEDLSPEDLDAAVGGASKDGGGIGKGNIIEEDVVGEKTISRERHMKHAAREEHVKMKR